MNLLLEVKYLKLEKSRNRLLDALEQVDPVILNTKIAEDKWSIAQIVAHLVLVEEFTLSYMQRKLEEPEKLPAASLKNYLKSLLLKLALKSKLKFKAPPRVADVPDKVCLQSLRRQWNGVRYTFEDLLTDLPPELLDKCLFKHPYVGPLSVTQCLTFLQDHFDHHAAQIKHLKQALQPGTSIN
ncbi:DinB family protein [Pontibacter qinzhouensis]|uniref:DinB family protein n=1 Tax=Pontibacter qinzhouensis TaxID=2603253 RepID=A0A5C8K719_9BACT|nr:DinB family protein [Pontibacter qinzhouensis]TXK44885.1 DinB family protein [Pontibacter qinzhouensis]